MRILNNYQNTNIYQFDQATNQNKTSSTLSNTSSSNLSNQAAILELSANEQMEMEDYQPYSVNSVQATYAMAAATFLTPIEVYESWFNDMGALADQRLRDSYAFIVAEKETQEGLTADFLNQLYEGQGTWLIQQRDNLYSQLTTQTSMTQAEWEFFDQKAIDFLDKIDHDMWDAISNYINTGEEATFSFNGTISAYRNFESSLGQKIANYLGPLTDKVSQRNSTISNAEIEDYLEEFNQWQSELMNRFTSDLENAKAPNNMKSMLEDFMQNTFDIVMPDIWNSISQTIHQKNSEIENANRRRQQAAEAEQLTHFKVDYKTGPSTNEIRISTSKPSTDKYASKFVVEGSNGKSKDIYISFSDERLKKEFDKKIKAAGLEGKKLSMKEFNEIVKELKNSLKDLGEIDIDALMRKMEKGEKDLDFEHSMNRFILYLKRAVK